MAVVRFLIFGGKKMKSSARSDLKFLFHLSLLALIFLIGGIITLTANTVGRLIFYPLIRGTFNN